MPYQKVNSVRDFFVALQEEPSPQEVCVIFDIDETLLACCGEQLILQTNTGRRCFNQWFDALSLEKKEQHIIETFIHLPFALIEKKAPSFIKQLKIQQFCVLGCTAMPGQYLQGVNLCQWRLNQLSKNGITFSSLLPKEEKTIFEHEGREIVFQQGIIFTGWDKPKGSAVKKLFDKLSYKPKKIYCLDDKTFQLETIADTFPTQCVPFHFIGQPSRPEGKEHSALFQYQLQHLEQHHHWISDKEALKAISELNQKRSIDPT